MIIAYSPEYHIYWSRQHIFATPIFILLIRREQFEQLQKMVNFSNPENEDPMDSLRKWRFFLVYLIARYKENYSPEEHLEIDKYYHSGRGRLSFCIYITIKQEQYGVQTFIFRESKTCYLLLIYTGTTTKCLDQPDPLPVKFYEYENSSKLFVLFFMIIYIRVVSHWTILTPSQNL